MNNKHWQIDAANLDDALMKSLLCLKDQGSVIKNERTNSETMELLDYSVVINNPTDRNLSLDKRGNNIIAQIAETLWVLSGYDSLDYLSPFLPRAVNYSDDGKTWRAAYGKIMRHSARNLGRSTVSLGFDQLANVINILKEDPSSRQAFITINLPMDNATFLQTKDTPCTLDIIFNIRDRKLNAKVIMRSNDAIFGFSGINVYEWTVIQELMAAILGVGIGYYSHNVMSYHIYETHYDKMNRIIEANVERDHEAESKSKVILNLGEGISRIEDVDYIVANYIRMIDTYRQLTKQKKPLDELKSDVESFLADNSKSNFAIFTCIPILKLINDLGFAKKVLMPIEATDLYKQVFNSNFFIKQ
ncbi:thymidylate synthase [Maribacter phage Colly_1]|uniref:Thymidylate synthase n=1 Tax=Maribacter phage Colly_1 TaxID=2745691 RepID=A0A8E4UXR5_9CAUD|nr:thymidylate synthase [Maribacter phage Colly_1]QQO97198.1 thymidylate synthase [Maribacter phage Colly_1]